MFNRSSRGAKDNALTSHVNGLGFDSRRRSLFILIFWSFCFWFVFVFYFILFRVFFKRYFHILTDLNYAGRLIASSLAAFISKIINPRVGHRHPLITFSVDTYNWFVA